MYDNIVDEFLSQRNPLYQAAKASRYAQPLEGEEEPLPAPKSLKEQAEEKVNSGLLRKVGSTALSGIAAAGNLLDLPGSMVRDVASWVPGGTKAQNPFDQVLDPFGKNASENRIEGRELLRNSGLIRKKNNWGNFMGGMAMEMAIDPTTFFGVNALSKAGKAFEKAGLTRNIKGMVNEIAEMNGKLPSKLGGAGWKTHFTGGRALEHIQKLRDHVAKNDVARVMAGKMVANGTNFNSLDELKELEGLKDLNWGIVDDGSGYKVYQYEIPDVAEGAKAKADEVAGEWKLNENATEKFREIINGKSVNMTYGRAKALVKDNYENTYGGSFEEALDQPLYSFLSFKVPFAEGTRTPLIKSATPDEWWNRRMEKLQDAPAKDAPAPPSGPDADISGQDADINPNTPKTPQVDAAQGVAENQEAKPADYPATSGHPGDVSSTGDNVSPTSLISETLAKDLNITPDTPRGRVLSQLIPLQDEAYTRAQVPVMDALAKNLSKLRGESEDSIWESLSYLQANNKGELDKLMKDGGKWDELFQAADASDQQAYLKLSQQISDGYEAANGGDFDGSRELTEQLLAIEDKYTEGLYKPVAWETSSSDELVKSLKPLERRVVTAYFPFGDDLRKALPASDQLRPMSLRERLAALKDVSPTQHETSINGFGSAFAENMGGAMGGDFSGLEGFIGAGLDAEWVNDTIHFAFVEPLRDAFLQTQKGSPARKAIAQFTADMAKGLDAAAGGKETIYKELREFHKHSNSVKELFGNSDMFSRLMPGAYIKAASYATKKLQATYSRMSEAGREAIRKVVAPIIDSLNSVNGSRLMDELEPEWNMARQSEAIDELFQDKGKAARGIILSQGSKHIISLFTGKADFSTNLHELAHFSRKMLPEELQAKATDGVKELLGGKSVTTKGGKWTVEAEEAFAKEFENYLLKGDAPNAALKDVFEKIKEFMLQVYKSLAGHPIDINPKLKEVFDTILGKEEGLAKKADAPAPPKPSPALATAAPTPAATPAPVASTSVDAVSAPAEVTSAPANVNPIIKTSKRPSKETTTTNPVVESLLKSINRARPLDTAEAAVARKEVEQAVTLPREERLNAFQQIAAKWKKPVDVVDETPTPSPINEAVKGTPIGEGGNAKVYALDDTSVVRVPKGIKGDIKDDFKPVEHPLTKLGIKVGQATSENSQGVQILQRQKGIEAGLATPRLVPEELRDATYEKSVLLAAGMPDEAYDEFANTLKALDEAGYQFDPSKSSNLLIDEDAGKFNLVDVNESKSGKPQASLEYMLIPLMGNTYAHHYKGTGLQAARKAIVRKATEAARKAGIKLELGSSGKYSLELAGLPEKSSGATSGANPLITAARAGYPDITPQKTEATTAPSGSFLRSRKRELEQKIEDAGEFDLDDELPALQRQLDEVNAQLKDSAPAPRQTEPELDPELEAINAWEPGKVSDNVSPPPKELLAARGKEAAQEAVGIAPDETPPETPPAAQLAPELKPVAAETPTTEDLLTRWIRSNKRDKGYIGTFRDSQGLSPEQMDALHDAMKKDARFERQKDGGYYPTSEAIANVTKEDNERLAWLTTQSLDSATIGEPIETYRKGDYRDGKGFATDPEFAASEFAKRKNAHLPNGHPRQYVAQKVDDNTWTVAAEEVSTPSTPPATAPVGVNPLIAAAKEAPAALPAETWELDGEDYMMGDWMLSPEKAGYRIFKNGVKQPQVGSLEKMQAFAESQAPSNPLLAKARPREGDEFFINPDKAEKPPADIPAAASPKAPTEAMSPEKVAVLEEHHDFIQNIARSKTKDANEADDLAQDVRIKLTKKMDDPEFDLKDVRGWIATTARTTNIDNIRRRARQAELVGDGLELAAAKDTGRMAKSAMVMDKILDIVPENVQHLLRMRHQEGLTTAQIAERLLAETGEKVSVDALNKRMSRVWTETQEIVSDTARLEKAQNITDAERAAAQASIDERLANLRAGSPKSGAIEQIKELDVDKLFQEPNKLEADFNENGGKQVPAPLLRDAVKAAADAAAEVSGLASKGTNAAEPEWLDDVMDAIDKGEHLFFNNPVMLRAAALFDRTTYGGVTEEEQKVARMAAKEHEESQYQFREMLTGIVRVIAKTGYLDEAPLIKTAANTSKNGARKAARAVMNQRHGEIRKFLETKTDNPMELYLDGDIFKDAETRALIEDQLRLMRKIMPEELRKDALAGITTPALRDEGVDYFPREEYSFGGPRSKSERNEIVFGTRAKHQSKRAASRKNIKEGTAVLDDMSLDPNISGKYWQQPMLGKGVDSVDEDAKYIQEKYGDRILLDSDYDEFTDGSREINRKGKSKLKRIASDIATLNPEHVNKQIPLYGYNFLHDFARRVEDGYAKRGVARAAQQLAIQNISVGQQYGIGKYFETIKLDNPNAYRNVINGAGHGEQYDAYLKTELEKFKSELKEKAEKAAKDTPDASPYVEYEKDDITYRLDGDKVFMVSHLEDGEEILEELAGDLFDKKIEESLNLPKRYSTKVANRGAGFSVSREVYEGGTRFLKPWTTPSEVGMAKSVFRAALNFWKSHLTLPFPQFHGRNGISGQIQNFFYGAFDNASGKSLPQNPLKLMNQARVLRGGHAIKGIYNELPKPIRDVIDTTSTDTDLDKKATEWLQNRIFKWGFTSDKQGIAAERLGDSASNIMSQMPGLSPPKGPLGIFRNPSGDATWSDMFNPTEILGGGRPARVPIEDGAIGDLVGKANPQKMKWTWRTPEESNFIPVRAGEDVAQYMEDINRTTAFIGFLKQGFDEQEAARKTLAIHFDYSNLSEFEKGLKNFIPFYVFTSKVVPLTFGDLFRNPGGKQAWAIRATTRAQDEETPAPDNVLRSTAIPLGETATGADRYLTGLGLGFEDALSFTGALRGDVRGTASEIVSRLRPEIQATGELATGRSLFFDKELNDLDPQVGRLASNIRANITGERPDGQADPILGSRGLEFLLGKSPLSRYVNTANNLLDTRKNAGYKFLNTATGVKVTDVEPWQKDRTNIDRASELLKGMGAKTSTITYLPKWKKDRMSPEELEQANEIQSWISGIQKGGRERKKIEDAADGEVESVNPRSAAVKKGALTTIMQELRQAAAQDREALQAEALDLANGIGDRDFAKKALGPALFKESERIRAEKKKQRDKEAMDSWLGEFQARGAARRKNAESLAASMSAGLGDD